jgi:energy-coupling factor transporter ATP-binding protein EcfA2
MHLAEIIIKNRAPFGDLRLSLRAEEVAVLVATNGKGKTTLFSYVADAIYEFTKHHFSDVAKNPNDYYRVANPMDVLDPTRASIVYLRFQDGEQYYDFADVRRPCSKDEYLASLDLGNPIDFDSTIANSLKIQGNAKAISPSLDRTAAEKIFKSNVVSYFPAYRFETPSFLHEERRQQLSYNVESGYSGRLGRSLESTGCLPNLLNWIMDVALDLQYKEGGNTQTFISLNQILTLILYSKIGKPVRFGVGPRNLGSTRLRVVTREQSSIDVYPTLMRLSSGEAALLCLFAEIVRQADLLKTNIKLDEISGIVLVDEIDKHLHIKLQKETLPNLLKIFPCIQFIASSHSPFFNMGLAEQLPERSRLIDLSSGLSMTPQTDPEYQEVYELMISQNERFKGLYDDLLSRVTPGTLQVITEGRNIEHISKAVALLAPHLLSKINIVSGAEDRTGNQQMKNAFDVLAYTKHETRFLFVWDCDSLALEQALKPAPNVQAFFFAKQEANTVAKKGVENLYDAALFTEEVYEHREVETDYGGMKREKVFSKSKFLNKIKRLQDPAAFKRFLPLISRIEELTGEATQAR